MKKLIVVSLFASLISLEAALPPPPHTERSATPTYQSNPWEPVEENSEIINQEYAPERIGPNFNQNTPQQLMNPSTSPATLDDPAFPSSGFGY